LSDGNVESRLRSRLVLVIRGRGGRERKACSRSLLLGEFGGLLGVGKSERVPSLMTSARGSTTTASASGVLSSLGLGLRGFEAAEGGVSRSPRGGRGRRSHAHVGKCRLITAM
jgi:hypothetical protein